MKSKLLKLLDILSEVFVIIACIYFVNRSCEFLRHCLSDWHVERLNVQERAYEALSLCFFAYGVHVIALSCLIVVLRLYFVPKPGLFSRAIAGYGFRPVLYLLAIFAALLLSTVISARIIDLIPEVDEHPRTLNLRICNGCFGIAALLAFEGAFAMFIAWCRNRLKKGRKNLA